MSAFLFFAQVLSAREPRFTARRFSVDRDLARTTDRALISSRGLVRAA